jgi:hypothetical protein
MNVPLEQPVSPVSPDQAIAHLAASQHGVFTWDQALACGVSPEMVRTRVAARRWERLGKGVYRLAGAPETWRQKLLAACFSAGPGAVASHRAAAGLYRLPAGRPRLEITVPRGRRFRRSDVVAHESSLLPPVDITVVDAIPVTTPARTLVDLPAVVPPERVEDVLDAALSSGLVTRPRVLWRLNALAEQGRPGIQVLRRLIEARAPATDVPASVLESGLRRVIAPLGLPEPVWGHWVRVDGRWRKVDAAWPVILFGIEGDGWADHSGRPQWEDDLLRQNGLVADGWALLRFSWNEVQHRPEHVRTVILRALERLERTGRRLR